MTERTVEDAGPYIGNDKFLCITGTTQGLKTNPHRENKKLITGITQEFEICVHRENEKVSRVKRKKSKTNLHREDKKKTRILTESFSFDYSLFSLFVMAVLLHFERFFFGLDKD